MLRDRLALVLVALAHRVHVRTDPACSQYRPARVGTLLDRASRGLGCVRCLGR